MRILCEKYRDSDTRQEHSPMGFMNTILNNEKQNPELWYRKGRELCTSGYYLDALEALDKMLAKNASHADSWFLKGYALYQMGKYEESLQFLDQALQFNPELHEALTYKGLIYSGFGRHSEAITQYDRALAINSRYGKAWYVKGLTLAIMERYDEAIIAYEEVLQVEPKHIDALAGISIAMKKRERSRAGKPVEKPVNLHLSLPVTTIVADIKHEVSDQPITGFAPPSTASISAQVPSVSPPDLFQKKTVPRLFKQAPAPESNLQAPPGYAMHDSFKTIPSRALQYNNTVKEDTITPTPTPAAPKRNSYDDLIHETLETIGVNGGDSQSLHLLGDLYIKVGKYQLATEAYEHVLELDPENAPVWAALGDARRKLGIYDEAQFAYDRALEINNEDIQTWISRAKALAMQNRNEEAIDSCDCAIEHDNANIDAWLYKGFILKKIQRHSEALHAYDHVLTINPHHDHAIRQRKTLIDGS